MAGDQPQVYAPLRTALWRRAVDDSGYLEFASAHSDRLFRTACLLTGDWHLAEDLLQETFGKLYRSWRRVERVESPGAYAHTTLVRTYLTHRRRRSSSERPLDVLPERAEQQDDPELRLTLLDGLSRLSPRDRAVLVLRYWEDRSVEETARALGIGEGAVRVQAHRALRRLRALLGDELTEIAS